MNKITATVPQQPYVPSRASTSFLSSLQLPDWLIDLLTIECNNCKGNNCRTIEKAKCLNTPSLSTIIDLFAAISSGVFSYRQNHALLEPHNRLALSLVTTTGTYLLSAYPQQQVPLLTGIPWIASCYGIYTTAHKISTIVSPIIRPFLSAGKIAWDGGKWYIGGIIRPVFTVAPNLPLVGHFVRPGPTQDIALSVGLIGMSYVAWGGVSALYNNPSYFIENLGSDSLTLWENFKKDPKETTIAIAENIATTTSTVAAAAAEKGVEKSIEWGARVSFATGKLAFNRMQEWVAENGFDLLLNLPIYATKLAAKTANFAVFAAPRIAYEGFASLDNPTRALLIAYYSAIAYIIFKPRVPGDIEFTSGSLIPRTIRKISGSITNKCRQGLQKLEPYTAFAKKINTSLFPKKPEPIFNEKLQKEIDDVTRAIMAAKQNDGFLANLLLTGEPGTGKTMIGKEIAERSGCHFVKMTGASLVNMIGSNVATIHRDKKGAVTGSNLDARPQATKLREILAFGQGKPHWFFWLPNKVWSLCTNRIPTIVFIDEIDLFLKKKELLQKIDMNRLDLLYTFLAETGELSKNLMIIGTTNSAKEMDEAARSRFATTLSVGAPGKKERARILKEHVDNAFPEHNIPERKSSLNEEGIARIAAKTEYLTGRDLAQLVWRLRREKSLLPKDQLLSQAQIDEVTSAFVERKREFSDNPYFQAAGTRPGKKKSFFSIFS